MGADDRARADLERGRPAPRSRGPRAEGERASRAPPRPGSQPRRRWRAGGSPRGRRRRRPPALDALAQHEAEGAVGEPQRSRQARWGAGERRRSRSRSRPRPRRHRPRAYRSPRPARLPAEEAHRDAAPPGPPGQRLRSRGHGADGRELPRRPASAEALMLRGAVVGLGMIGRHHARILQSSPGDRVRRRGRPERGRPLSQRDGPRPRVPHARRAARDRAGSTSRSWRSPPRTTWPRWPSGSPRRASTCWWRSRWPGRRRRRPRSWPPASRRGARRGRPRRALQPGAARAAAPDARRPDRRGLPDRHGARRPVPRPRAGCGSRQGPRHPRPRPRALARRTRRSSRVAAQTVAQDGRATRGPRLVDGPARGRHRLQLLVDWLTPDEGPAHAGRGRARDAPGRTRSPPTSRSTRTATSASEWDSTQALRGVSEGNAATTRWPGASPCSWRSRRSARSSRRSRGPGRLARGRTAGREMAEAVLASAPRAGQWWYRCEDRGGAGVKAVVVALGKIGLPHRGAVARAGPPRHRAATSTRGSSSS